MNLAVYPRRSARLTELVTPLKPLEAMLMGIPVVASDVGGHRELIEDQKTGFLFKADAIDDLVRAIGRCVEDPDLCQHLARRARESVVRARSWSSVADAYLNLYESLLA